ncbi:MAG TPA: zinc ribbon domain-containing protein [Candidatus Saccharimonadales bacterium]|nr:zinc ribbon domain-containing protein [Candidatus Saccharimonadales bacterium]
MHCPNCGKKTSIDQKFCRSCGMGLEAVSKAIASHQSGIDSSKPPVRGENSALRRMAIMLFWGIVVFLMGGVILGVSKKMLHNDLVGLIGLVMVIAGAILATYAVISPLWQQANKSGQATEPKSAIELESSAQTLPEGLSASPPSITEQTTNILETEAAKTLRGESSKETGV